MADSELRNTVKKRRKGTRSTIMCTYDGCSYSAPSVSALDIHIRVHTKERPYKCEKCPYKAAALSNLRQHVQNIHRNVHNNGGSQRRYFCRHPGCTYSAFYQAWLKNHEKLPHQKRDLSDNAHRNRIDGGSLTSCIIPPTSGAWDTGCIRRAGYVTSGDFSRATLASGSLSASGEEIREQMEGTASYPPPHLSEHKREQDLPSTSSLLHSLAGSQVPPFYGLPLGDHHDGRTTPDQLVERFRVNKSPSSVSPTVSGGTLSSQSTTSDKPFLTACAAVGVTGAASGGGGGGGGGVEFGTRLHIQHLMLLEQQHAQAALQLHQHRLGIQRLVGSVVGSQPHHPHHLEVQVLEAPRLLEQGHEQQDRFAEVTSSSPAVAAAATMTTTRSSHHLPAKKVDLLSLSHLLS